MSDKVYVGQKAQSFKLGQEYEPFSRVTMWYDDEHYYTAGDDTGREMVLECPWATQQIVDSCLNKIKGFVYRPFEATGVQLDPAAELGDGITINGHYSMIVQTTEHFDAAGLCDVSAPGEQEVDHEYPYIDPRDRELKRRVKLGQKYQGVSITRKDGLVITETDGETDGAKVVLNSKELSFYDAGGGRVLYFDPASGTYKFLGELNVADNFIVDKMGNVTMKGSVTIGGSLSMTGTSNWLMTRYSTNKNASVPEGWSEAWDKAWDNTSTQVWAIYSYNGGATWTQPMLAQGKDGERGPTGATGSSANIPAWVKAYTASAEFNTLVTDEWVVAMNLFGSKIFGTEIYGGKITSDTTIDVGTDVHVGNNLYLGKLGDNDGKAIYFSNIARIVSFGGTSGLDSGSLRISCNHLDMSLIGDIHWGDNSPPAVFG